MTNYSTALGFSIIYFFIIIKSIKIMIIIIYLVYNSIITDRNHSQCMSI
ncbi:MAG: hypothetical protein HNEKOMLI_00144 [Sodalis sp. Psp]|nr:hypothetical protein [Sodalis sp. Psp]MCR3756641.1 hypothetical protein [Sodalis sp. Ppy]